MNETTAISYNNNMRTWKEVRTTLPRKAEHRLRAILHAKFPHAFVAHKGEKVPLKIGITNDMIARLPEIDPETTPEQIRCFIQDYCHGARYLRNMIKGANRVDLDGNVTGQVSEGAARAAARQHKKRLEYLRKTFKTEPAPRKEVAA